MAKKKFANPAFKTCVSKFKKGGESEKMARKKCAYILTKGKAGMKPTGRKKK